MADDPEQPEDHPRPALTPEQRAIRETGIRIADALGETLQAPRAQVGRVVRVLGTERAQALYQQTLAIEAAGGMMIPSGTRRRTPGGVFFKLAYEGISNRQRKVIFRPHARARTRQRESSPTVSTPAPAAAIVTEIPNATGEARTVKITLVGRPSRIIPKQGHIITSMTATKVPTLPKGMPTPPATPTIYTVYIAAKQWAKVAPALDNPEDVLIVEGMPVYDPELEGIAVYVTNASTKQLQQAQRATQAAERGA